MASLLVGRPVSSSHSSQESLQQQSSMLISMVVWKLVSLQGRREDVSGNAMRVNIMHIGYVVIQYAACIAYKYIDNINKYMLLIMDVYIYYAF